MRSIWSRSGLKPNELSCLPDRFNALILPPSGGPTFETSQLQQQRLGSTWCRGSLSIQSLSLCSAESNQPLPGLQQLRGSNREARSDAFLAGWTKECLRQCFGNLTAAVMSEVARGLLANLTKRTAAPRLKLAEQMLHPLEQDL